MTTKLASFCCSKGFFFQECTLICNSANERCTGWVQINCVNCTLVVFTYPNVITSINIWPWTYCLVPEAFSIRKHSNTFQSKNIQFSPVSLNRENGAFANRQLHAWLRKWHLRVCLLILWASKMMLNKTMPSQRYIRIPMGLSASSGVNLDSCTGRCDLLPRALYPLVCQTSLTHFSISLRKRKKRTHRCSTLSKLEIDML